MPVIDIASLPMRIVKPTEGAPDGDLPGAGALVGVDGNPFAVIFHVRDILKRAGASKAYMDAYRLDAMSGDYDRLLSVSMAYLTED